MVHRLGWRHAHSVDMRHPAALRVVQVVAALLAFMYVTSTYAFIRSHTVEFIDYTATGPAAIWTLNNLAIRLFAIAVGFFIALASRSEQLLALMFAVRLAADVGDTVNSLLVPGLPALVPATLVVFVAVEALYLAVLVLRIRRPSPSLAPSR